MHLFGKVHHGLRSSSFHKSTIYQIPIFPVTDAQVRVGMPLRQDRTFKELLVSVARRSAASF